MKQQSNVTDIQERFRQETQARKKYLPIAQRLVRFAYDTAQSSSHLSTLGHQTRSLPHSFNLEARDRSAEDFLLEARKMLIKANLDPNTDRAWKKAGIPSGLHGLNLLRYGDEGRRYQYKFNPAFAVTPLSDYRYATLSL